MENGVRASVICGRKVTKVPRQRAGVRQKDIEK